MSEPQFSPGEEVIVTCPEPTKYNGNHIIENAFDDPINIQCAACNSRVWYKLIDVSDLYFSECTLKKRPPPKEESSDNKSSGMNLDELLESLENEQTPIFTE